MGDTLKVLEAVDVSYSYPDGTVALRDVSVSIEEGERVAILGANGSGKSTLLFVLAGLLKPTKGEVRIFGMKPDKNNIEEIRRRVGIVFQNPDDFLFNPTVRDELEYVPRQLDWDEEAIRKAVSELSELFDISDLLKKPPFRLSGGEKKKVEIASVLVFKPRVLMLDEPTSNVDGKTRRTIIKLLREYDGTLVLATHEMDVVRALSDRVIALNLDHRVEIDGGLELLDDAELMERTGIL